jgi:hypothetical protein
MEPALEIRNVRVPRRSGRGAAGMSGATVIFSLASLGCSVAALRYGSAGLALVGLGLGLLACLTLYMLDRP